MQEIAIVCGGAGGIGRAVVGGLSRAGFLPVILDSNQTTGDEAISALQQHDRTGVFVHADLTKKTEVETAFAGILKTYGRVDVLVNLAGGTLHANRIEDFSTKDWQRVIDVNLKATFLTCQAAIPIMKRARSGVIINTSSNFGVTGSPRRTAYSAAKAAVIAFTKSLALEVAPYGIRANVIAPGLTATQRVMSHYSPEQWNEQTRPIPIGRAAEPEEIAEGVVFLSSSTSGFMTGQTLHVNGGLVLP
jgi:3-oxoacyl-[acyl-carrier protein] reductase